MEQEDSQLTSISISASTSGGNIIGRNRYKLWVLAGILVLAFWSMFTGSVTLKWSTPHLSSPQNFLSHQELDILEVEEREKMVRHMWEVYTQSHVRLPKFWLEAFEAAYEYLTSDVPSVRDAAVSEIAIMSFSNSVDLLDYYATRLLTANQQQQQKKGY